jgi:hypothetical protein
VIGKDLGDIFYQTICKSKIKPGRISSPDNSVGEFNTSTG